jgi:dienelactone hydrolase
MLAGAELGVCDGLDALGAVTGPVIAAGYSYGAGLAVVAAAEAERWGIPVPAAVYGVFPYFVRGNGPLLVPPTTTVTMLVGDRDQVVGTRGATSIEHGIAPHPAAVRLLESSDAFTYGHLSVLQSTPAAREAFWAPLDRIVDRLAPR